MLAEAAVKIVHISRSEKDEKEVFGATKLSFPKGQNDKPRIPWRAVCGEPCTLQRPRSPYRSLLVIGTLSV